jgi:hypothetical protein
MFNLFSNQSDNLLNLYVLYFKISFFENRIKAEENLDILFSLLNDNLDVPEWNRAMRSLAKAWKFDPQESASIVDVIKVKRDLIGKILLDSEDQPQKELFDRAKKGVRELYEEID